MNETETIGATPARPGSAEPRRPGRLRRAMRPALWILVVLAVAGGAFLGIEQLIGNFHTVVAGELYRSAQISADQLADAKARYGIRTVINLRGPSTRSWYVDEVRESERLGLNHIDFKLSAEQELTEQQVEELVAVMRDAPKPILVHCKGGSDRTGLASALYVAAIARKSEAAAEWQLSPYYGHFSIPLLPSWAMDQSFERAEPWLGFKGS
ncbi:protein tyrosine/serine phosphatase [Angulomicrobium tetraedrale]|uniref:Protein tyrosine/serine phosphatase n=1 Tax=Ancylobacter tetraedralis TaxID=217068 RepID=A0A839ZET3_9HYPH|nr:protein tyrosine/serine phosphatase [Ancylobacter tetraedralis]